MENRKDQKPDIQKEAVWILKSLLGAYVVTNPAASFGVVCL